MSREIKFRIWDKISGMWLKSFNANLLNICYLSNVEINQYTGLKDKNGKEIYEGDIIRLKHHIDKRINVVGKVVFLSEQASFGIIDDLGQEYPLFRNTTEQIEIIGNIYENLELLEGKDE